MLATGSCADAQLRAADCSHRRLVRRLCASVLAADGQGSGSDGARLRALEDTAHAVLLGFEVCRSTGSDPDARGDPSGLPPPPPPPLHLRCLALPDRRAALDVCPRHCLQGDVPYVAPDERAAQAAGGLAEAAQQLRAEGYPGLATDLEVGAERLKR